MAFKIKYNHGHQGAQVLEGDLDKLQADVDALKSETIVAGSNLSSVTVADKGATLNLNDKDSSKTLHLNARQQFIRQFTSRVAGKDIKVTVLFNGVMLIDFANFANVDITNDDWTAFNNSVIKANGFALLNDAYTDELVLRIKHGNTLTAYGKGLGNY